MSAGFPPPPQGEAGGKDAGGRPRQGLARRHRRILWTLSLGVLLLAGATTGVVWVYKRDQPRPYQPGEEIEGITRELDRPAGEAGSATPASAPGGGPMPRFTDVTQEAGLGEFRSFQGDRTSQLPEDMGSGAAWGDYDNDDDEDLFLVSAGGPLGAPPAALAPSLLFRNLGDGRFGRVAEFPETRILGMGAAWGDYNRDGWLDLVISGYGQLLLFRNEHGKFLRDASLPSPEGFWSGVSWGDYDNDGDPDLYVCGYVRYLPAAGKRSQVSKQFGLEVPYTLNPSSYSPERNLLFRNNGDGTFAELAGKLGVDNPTGRSLSALWHDFDGNGWLDLYVANDVSENKLYLNDKGKLADSSQVAWVGEYRGSMGLAAGDFDGDGDDDLFISHWVAQQYALYQSLLSEQKLLGKDPARAKPAPAGVRFVDVAEAKGIGQPSLRSIGWGAEFADFDADGWLDLAVANGSTFEAGEPRRLVPMRSFLFWNRQGEFFRDLAPWSPPLAVERVSRGLAIADYNNDGAIDLLIVDRDGGVRLLRNEMRRGHWLGVALRRRVGRRNDAHGFGDGAVVVVEAGGRRFRRSVASASYLSQSSRRLHFGLGDAGSVTRIEVRWPGGRRDAYERLAVDTVWELMKDDPLPRRLLPASAAKPSREQLIQFWDRQRAAMDALKKHRDPKRAITLFREALAIDPQHEDSRYYLANCLAASGDIRAALVELEELARLNPRSHRACQRFGVLSASNATSRVDLAAAEKWLNRALALNPEETGAMLVLAEIALVKGDRETAERLLELACRTNPRAVGGFLLRGFLAWERGEAARARELLLAARKAGGADWKPKGTASEGDVLRRMHDEATLLSPAWENWDGTVDPARAFRPLAEYLARKRSAAGLPRR